MHFIYCYHDFQIVIRIYSLNYIVLHINTLLCIVISMINQNITDITINESQSVNFLCQAVGEPVPDISWYFNDVMINVSDNSSKYMIVSRSLNITTTENTLTVYNVTSSDVGIYSCIATNVVGIDSDGGHLQVNG